MIGDVARDCTFDISTLILNYQCMEAIVLLSNSMTGFKAAILELKGAPVSCLTKS